MAIDAEPLKISGLPRCFSTGWGAGTGFNMGGGCGLRGLGGR